MKLKKMFAALALVIITGAAAQAQTQPARIKQGVKSGELTNKETKTLVKQQKETRQDVKAAKSDGVVTPGERAEIKQDKKQSSKAIYRKKHNAKVQN